MTLRVPFVDLLQQTKVVKDQVLKRYAALLESSAFILGTEVRAFEDRFASFCGVRHAVGVGNGTDALTLALRALDIGPGDEVITVANTFVATAEAIANVGAKPVLVDVDPATFNIEAQLAEAAVTPRTKAVIPVHLYGQVANMRGVFAVARKHGLAVVEDAAQAHGAVYQGQSSGSLGNLGCFSFYPGKNLGAYGDGGAVTTDDDALAHRIRMLRDHGSPQKYEHHLVGYNSRLDSLQAIVLSLKLEHLTEWNAERRRLADQYDELLAEVPGVTVPIAPRPEAHVYHLYVVRVPAEKRNGLRQCLESKGIQTGIHYPVPIHLTRAFAYLGYSHGSFPTTEAAAREIISLPMFPGLTNEQVRYVSEQLHTCLDQHEHS